MLHVVSVNYYIFSTLKNRTNSPVDLFLVSSFLNVFKILSQNVMTSLPNVFLFLCQQDRYNKEINRPTIVILCSSFSFTNNKSA